MSEETPAVVSEAGDRRDSVDRPDSDAVVALAALYGAERADNQNSLAQALVLVSMLIAYSVGVGAILATSPKIFTQDDGMPFLSLFLPFPVWSAVGFHTLLNSWVFAHNQSIEAIELELRKVHCAGEFVGGLAGRMVSDADLLKGERRPLWIATVMAYGGTAVIVLAFTFASTWLPQYEGVPLRWCLIALFFYLALAVSTFFSWRLIFKIKGPKLQEWVDSSR